MNRKIWMAALAAFVLVCSLSAADKPDFSGEWKLSSPKSDFGPMPGFEKWDLAVTHKDPSLKVKSTMSNPQMGERTTDSEYSTTGEETVTGEGAAASTVSARWDGATLLVKSVRKVNMQGEQVEISSQEKWSLSEDGKTLTVDTLIQSPMGELQMKRVMDKQ
jgi:hypothetical protein